MGLLKKINFIIDENIFIFSNISVFQTMTSVRDSKTKVLGDADFQLTNDNHCPGPVIRELSNLP